MKLSLLERFEIMDE